MVTSQISLSERLSSCYPTSRPPRSQLGPVTTHLHVAGPGRTTGQPTAITRARLPIHRPVASGRCRLAQCTASEHQIVDEPRHLLSRRLSTLPSGVGRQRRCCSRSGGAANATPKRARLAARAGQSGQPHLRAARLLWSGSGGRGGVSDLGGGGQLTAEACAASTSGSPSARTRNVVFWARRPRDARWNKSD